MESERFFILLLFSLCQTMNTAGWICFASIIDKIKIAYPEASLFDINYLSWIYLIAFLPVNPYATKYIESKGLRWSLLLGVFI